MRFAPNGKAAGLKAVSLVDFGGDVRQVGIFETSDGNRYALDHDGLALREVVEKPEGLVVRHG